MLNLESEVQGLNTHWGNILLLDFFLFSHSKASDANIGIIANFVHYGKTRLNTAVMSIL